MVIIRQVHAFAMSENEPAGADGWLRRHREGRQVSQRRAKA